MNARTVATVAALVASCGLPLTALADEPIGGALPILQHGDGCGKATILKQMAAAGLDPMGDASFPQGLAALSALDDTDVTHVDLDIETDFNNQAIAGTCVTDITSLVNGLTEYTFRLRSQFNVTSVLVDGVPAAWVTDSTTSKTVTLPVTKNAGESFQLTVVYDGQTVSGFFGSIEWVIPSLNQGPWWMNDNMVYTLSQPYYSYTWWPAKDGDVGDPGDYSDKFTLDFSITADNQYSSTANGVLTGVDNLPGNKSRYNFHSDYEIPTYLVAFATSDFNSYTQTWNYSDGVNNYSMPVELNFTQSNDLPSSRDNWFVVLPMLTEFSDRFGVYPFFNEKYGMYEFGFGGGMEHQTNTGQLAYPPYTALDWLTAHELMHQWFGDNVTCKTWNDIWLNEGFATYGEAVWEEVKGGTPAMLAYMNSDNLPGSVAGTVYVYDTSDANVIFDTDTVYLKAGWAVMMLRHKLGESVFNQAMQDYQTWYGQSGATTDEFRDAVIASSGVDITRFIDQWVYGAGAPIYRYGYRTDTVNGQKYLRLRVRQTQPGTDGLGQAFEVPVDIRVNGTDDYVINNDEYTQHFVIPISSNASSVALDPDGWILKRSSTSSEAYSNGPPVVITAGATDTEATVSFVEPVNASGGDFSVVTDDGLFTPVAFGLSYDGPSNTATLDFGGTLPNGDYLVTVHDSLTSQAAGIALDGEGSAVPSGDGVPGGDYTFGFTVSNPCPADLNGDGVVDNGDIGVFVTFFLGGNLAADFNGDGILDNGDIGAFIAAFLSGC